MRFDIDDLQRHRRCQPGRSARRPSRGRGIIAAGTGRLPLTGCAAARCVPALVESAPPGRDVGRRRTGAHAAPPDQTWTRARRRSSEARCVCWSIASSAKLLHEPTVRLKAQAANGNGVGLRRCAGESCLRWASERRFVPSERIVPHGDRPHALTGPTPAPALGTRGSALARWQTEYVAGLLRAAWPGLTLHGRRLPHAGRPDARQAAAADRRQGRSSPPSWRLRCTPATSTWPCTA